MSIKCFLFTKHISKQYVVVVLFFNVLQTQEIFIIIVNDIEEKRQKVIVCYCYCLVFIRNYYYCYDSDVFFVCWWCPFCTRSDEIRTLIRMDMTELWLFSGRPSSYKWWIIVGNCAIFDKKQEFCRDSVNWRWRAGPLVSPSYLDIITCEVVIAFVIHQKSISRWETTHTCSTISMRVARGRSHTFLSFYGL